MGYVLQPPKRRIPKNNATPIEVTKPRQWNNGNIEIVQSEPPAAVMKPRVHVEEVLINGRRYRVPERIVILDFWGKLNRLEPEQSRYITPIFLYATLAHRSPSGRWTWLRDFHRP